MDIKTLLNDGTTERRFSFEVLPPLKGNGTASLFRNIDQLKEFNPQFINITTHHSEFVYHEREDGLLERQSIRRRPGTIAIAAAIQQRYGIPVIPHVICSGATKEDIEDESHIKAFLYRIVYTRALNVIKHRTVVNNHADSVKKITQFKLDYYNPEANDVMGYIEGLETRKQINDAIGELPAKCREVFILSYQHDKKNKEIAEQLGISIRTVEVHLYKAIKALRERLKDKVYAL